MIRRAAKAKLTQLLARFPAVALLGPRQVGKTTLALSLTGEPQTDESPLYLDLELPSDRAKLADPELYLVEHEGRLVILDEIHRLPGIFQTLRGLIDRRRRKGKRSGQFLLLGSASIDLLQQSAETLAGRIAYMELTPFLEERLQTLPPMPASPFGSVVAFQTASLRRLMVRASSGARPSSRHIWNEMFLHLVHVSQPRRFTASGRCWGTTRARC